jgi:hypothetical protein
MIPLSGFEWLAAFDLQFKGAIVRGTRDPKPAPLIDAQSLHEAWPSFPKPGDMGDPHMPEHHKQSDSVDLDEPDASYDPDAEIIQKLVYCKSIEEGKMSINKARSGFKYKLKKYLYNHPEELTSKTPLAVQLLLAVLKPKKHAITLHQFVNLSGDQIVELVGALRPHKPVTSLILLDVSFNLDFSVEHLSQILDIVSIHELIFWDNPNLNLEEVIELVRSTGGVKKLTTRGLFMEAFERWLIPERGRRRHLAALAQAAATAPSRGPIKQLVWVNAMTQNVDDTTTTTGMLCLEQCNVQKLAEILDPGRIRQHQDTDDFAFAEAMTFPLRDSWTTLAEFFTSCMRIEGFIAGCDGGEFGIHDSTARYPLQVPLMIATGNPNVSRFL